MLSIEADLQADLTLALQDTVQRRAFLEGVRLSDAAELAARQAAAATATDYEVEVTDTFVQRTRAGVKRPRVTETITLSGATSPLPAIAENVHIRAAVPSEGQTDNDSPTVPVEQVIGSLGTLKIEEDDEDFTVWPQRWSDELALEESKRVNDNLDNLMEDVRRRAQYYDKIVVPCRRAHNQENTSL